MFENEISQLEKNLRIPFPDRSYLLAEIKSDMETAYDDLVKNKNLSPEIARQEVIIKFLPNDEIVLKLDDIYVPSLQRILKPFSPIVQKTILNILLAIVPFFFILFLLTEVPMINFLQQGGIAIYLVLSLAGLALYIQLTRVFNWFILKDHQRLSLVANTSTPLYLAATTFLVGFLGTSVAYYKVFKVWAMGVLTLDQMKVAMYEPLPNIIMACFFAALIILIHLMIQARLRTIIE